MSKFAGKTTGSSVPRGTSNVRRQSGAASTKPTTAQPGSARNPIGARTSVRPLAERNKFRASGAPRRGLKFSCEVVSRQRWGIHG